MTGSVADFVLLTPLQYWLGNKVFFSILFVWFLVVWAIFGGAIARISAIHVARDEVISPLRAMKFSIKAFPSFFSAPLIPLIMVVILGAVVSVIGLLIYLPYAGPIAAGLLLVIPLLLGIIMMLLTVGCVAGAALMYPTIAVEGSDAFDAVSRALSHVFTAPWRLLFYAAVAMLYGAITYFFCALRLRHALARALLHGPFSHRRRADHLDRDVVAAAARPDGLLPRLARARLGRRRRRRHRLVLDLPCHLADWRITSSASTSPPAPSSTC